MSFRIMLLACLFGLGLIQCNSQQSISAKWQSEILTSSYSVYHTGMAPAGTGANFIVTFNVMNKESQIEVTQFEVNGEILETELKVEENRIEIIGNKFTPPNFESEDNPVPDFYKSDNYRGTIKLLVDNQVIELEIENFLEKEMESQNL